MVSTRLLAFSKEDHIAFCKKGGSIAGSLTRDRKTGIFDPQHQEKVHQNQVENGKKSKGRKHSPRGGGSHGHNRVFTNEQIFIVDSTYKGSFKDRILKDNLLEYKCQCCSLEPVWNGKKLVLQLEHKNGNRNDNRLENLEFLCPNCHTQTPTHSKNKRNI